MPLRVISWVIFAVLILAIVLGGMAIIQNNFPEYNKAIAVIPIVIGFIASIFKNRDLWKLIQNSGAVK